MKYGNFSFYSERRDVDFDLNGVALDWVDLAKVDVHYLDFLKKYGQYSRDDGLVLYEAEDLCERNLTFETNIYAPGYLLIGDDSGGTGFLLRVKDGGIYSSGLGDMSPNYFKFITTGFEDWAKNDFKID
ncbi:hypothetical protein HZU75_06965 [Chitinibacter fontanus]|uniref:SMI1/KNR4 family protein n=1 Tax=Chitinibacter fontanus TaxID=1737446 RepID=A0A7D5ZDS6_9NEIS|nr:hypothetical protein [Chitinibacter fontanus]QLI81284.1 hypothetical protein HZU75_06965 [Chitinibacter fontanus]